MAGPKTIKLGVSLDTSELKSQVESLKKELGKDLNMSGQLDANEIKSVFKDIAKDFSKQIQDALKDVKIPKGTATQSPTNEPLTEQIIKETRQRTGKASSEKSQEIKSIFDEERGKYIKQKPGEVYDKTVGKLFKSEEDRQKFITAQETKRQKFQDKSQDKRLKDLENSDISKLLQTVGVSKGTSIKAAEKVEALGPLGKPIQAGAGALRGAIGAGGGALGIAGAAVGGAALLGESFLRAQESAREFRQQQARKQFEGVGLLSAGKGLEAQVRAKGRAEAEKSGEGTVAGIKNVITSPMALLGSIFSNKGFIQSVKDTFKGGKVAIGEKESETRIAEMQPALQAIETAKAIRQPLMDIMRAGFKEGDLRPTLKAGAEQGFSAEETINQIREAQPFIGSKNIGNLPAMQELMNRTGVSVGEQAQSAETLAGASGLGIKTSLGKNEDIIKKGVAAGLDVSKSGQFLKATADFVQSSAGFGKVDVDAISTRLAESAKGFAGGGEATSMDIERAKQYEQMIKQESTATGGLAGLGNIMGIQGAFEKSGQKLDTGTMLALQNLSSNARPEEIQKILEQGGFSADKGLISDIQKSKTGGIESAVSQLGLDKNLAAGLVSKERGITTEQQLGIEDMTKFRGTLSTKDVTLTGAAGTEAQKSLQADAKASLEPLFTGLNSLSDNTKQVNAGMKDLRDGLTKAVEALNRYSTSIQRQAR